MMKGYNFYKGKKMICSRVIATAECSAGNESVGTMWNETKSFPATTTIQEIMDWAGSVFIGGKLTITPDLGTEEPTHD